MTDSGISDEIADARSAGLRYVDDAAPGYSRKRAKSGFAFFDRAGKKLTDAIPPAYESVWIFPFPDSYVQATARDARGRKQYRYHKKWREVRDAGKYESTLASLNAAQKATQTKKRSRVA